MKRVFALGAAALAAITVTCSTADAHWRKGDPRVKQVEVGAAVASTVAFFSIAGWNNHHHSAGYRWGAYGAVTAGCVVLSPFIATMVVHRPLTNREVHTLIGSCVVPIIGGWLVDAAYDANPQWEPQPAVVRHHRKKKKM